MRELIEKATDFLKAKGCTNSQQLFWIPAIMAEFADEYHKTQMEKLNGEIRESEKFCPKCKSYNIIIIGSWFKCYDCQYIGKITERT